MSEGEYACPQRLAKPHARPAVPLRALPSSDARAKGHKIPKCPNCGNDTFDTRYHEPGNR
ncbi:hypothetical protein GCM10010862_03370 [Devosia nitrariae]|uniref:Uncharacterized protein n=1 Tax=Devosia nitrariae TaxID=2071872 RepID=A0ABQ5VZ56_9HYPH|nr:hypothetical protein GCM10010862_03370 [Devosia nitrariae]